MVCVVTIHSHKANSNLITLYMKTISSYVLQILTLPTLPAV